jgi:hypothetical protein
MAYYSVVDVIHNLKEFVKLPNPDLSPSVDLYRSLFQVFQPTPELETFYGELKTQAVMFYIRSLEAGVVSQRECISEIGRLIAEFIGKDSDPCNQAMLRRFKDFSERYPEADPETQKLLIQELNNEFPWTLFQSGFTDLLDKLQSVSAQNHQLHMVDPPVYVKFP